MFPSNDAGYFSGSSLWSLSRTSSESNSTLDMHYAQTSGFDLETPGVYEANTPAANYSASPWQWNLSGPSGLIAPQRGPLTSDIVSAPSIDPCLPQPNTSSAFIGPLDSGIFPADVSPIDTDDLRTDAQFESIYDNSGSSFSSSLYQVSTQGSVNQSSNVSPSLASNADESPTAFKCPMGDATFTEEKTYRRHLKEHKKPYTCERCPMAFRFNRDLKRHHKTHNVYHKDGNQIRPGDYTMCPYTECKYHVRGFSRHDNYLRHVRNKHPQDESSINKVSAPRSRWHK